MSSSLSLQIQICSSSTQLNTFRNHRKICLQDLYITNLHTFRNNCETYSQDLHTTILSTFRNYRDTLCQSLTPPTQHLLKPDKTHIYATHTTTFNMNTYQPSLADQTSYFYPETDMQAYLELQAHTDQTLDTTPRGCELCGLRYGGFDMLMHIHFAHNLAYSDVCPCDDCAMVRLSRPPAGDWQPSAALVESGGFVAGSARDEVFQPATVPIIDLRESPVLSSLLANTAPAVNPTPFAQHRNASVAANYRKPQQQYTPVKASPSFSSPPKHTTHGTLAPMGSAPVIRIDSLSPAHEFTSPFTPTKSVQTKPAMVKKPQQYTSVKASPSLFSPKKHTTQETLAPMGSTPVIHIDSMSPAQEAQEFFSQFTPTKTAQTKPAMVKQPQHVSMSPAQEFSSPFTQTKTVQIKTAQTKPAMVKKPQHTRVDSAMSMQSLSAPSAVAKSIQPVMAKLEPPIKDLKLVPDKVAFHQSSTQLSEKNLPYEVSKVECGQMYEDNGKIFWIETKTEALTWLDGNDQIVKSMATGNNMKWCPCLPHNIPKEVPAWQIVCWQREAVAEGYSLRQVDLLDHGLALSYSGITNRVQKWQGGIGILPQTKSTAYNWPSKQAMDTVAGLTYDQARFNTWWNVGYIPSHDVWMAKQPDQHPGYRDLATLVTKDPKVDTPYYFIENPESRKVSEYIKLFDDAMLFLIIKAEECGMTGGYQELLPWFGKPAEDQWTIDLEADFIIEFGRWREGCHDTPSVAVLRTALEYAGSVAEVEAIKRADYSLTLWLQNVVAGLAPMKESRRSKDALKMDEVAKKAANRVIAKRKIDEVDDVEMYAGQGKKRAII